MARGRVLLLLMAALLHVQDIRLTMSPSGDGSCHRWHMSGEETTTGRRGIGVGMKKVN